jgi:hypothetical protein
MGFDRATLLSADASRAPIPLRDFTVVATDQPSQQIVLKVPEYLLQGTVLADQPGDEAGASIVLTTTDDRTYEGFVEVIAAAAGSRIYWCGVVFQSVCSTR